MLLANQPERHMSALRTATNAEHATAHSIKKRRISPTYVAALREYNFRVAREYNYLGAVFVTPAGQAQYEAETKRAYDACIAIGMGAEHGL